MGKEGDAGREEREREQSRRRFWRWERGREEGGGKGEGGMQRGRQEEGWEAMRKEGGTQSKQKAGDFISAKDVFAMGMVAIVIAPPSHKTQTRNLISKIPMKGLRIPLFTHLITEWSSKGCLSLFT